MRGVAGRLREQLLGDVNRLFVPREILLRSDGRVRYITISRRQQLAAAGVVAAFLGWTLLSSAGVLVTSHLLRARGDQVRQANAAYEDLRAQVIRSQARLVALARKLGDNQRFLLGLADEEHGTPAPHASQPPAGAGSGAIADSVAAALAEFGAALHRLESDNKLIEREMAAIAGKLTRAGEATKRAAAARDRYAARWRNAEARLADAGKANESLAGRVGELEGQLATLQLLQARNVATRMALRQQIADLTGELAASQSENERLARTVTGMQRTRAYLASDRASLRAARDELESRFAVLRSRLSNIQLTQQTAVQRLTERARVNVDEVEKTVAMTGIDVEGLLVAAARQLSAVGGPFIEPRRRFRTADELRILASVDKLGGEVERLEKLQVVLRTLPLASPLDSYSIESGFGPRRDPINGKRAQHEGLDLKNENGMPVLSTAPGKVVYAGWMGEYGRLVEIDHGLGIRTRYAHLKSISVKVGEEISYRHEIGKLGKSGRATGPHVHYEVRVNGKPYDPMNFLEAGKYVFKG